MRIFSVNSQFGKTNLLMLLMSIIFIQSNCQLYEWRGPNRTGVYEEYGLLKKWPENGPKLIWETNGLGAGYSSVTVSDDAIYITGRKDDTDVLTAFTLQGDKKWETTYGKSWTGPYSDSRCTPTYYNNKIFVISGQGDLVCLNTEGKIIWSKNYITIYGANAPGSGISESPIVVDSLVIVTPGGSKTSLVAFNIETGNVKWQTEPLNDISQYLSPKLIYHNGKKIIITLMEKNIIAVDSENGNILWIFNYADYYYPEDLGATNHAITPVYKNGYLLITTGYKHTTLKFKLAEDCKSAEIIWENKDINPIHGGVVLMNNYLYCSTNEFNSLKSWGCYDWQTGETLWNTNWHNSKGSVIAADGMLYLYEEKSGYVGLVNPNPEKLDVVSEFKITKGNGPHWSHPVICNGKLFIRHGDVLMVYLIEKMEFE